MVRYLPSVLVLVTPVLAACGNGTTTQTTSSQLLISGSGYIWSAQFDGTSVKLQNNITEPGVTPSWLLEGKSSTDFIANDENSNTTYTYLFGASSSSSSSSSSSLNTSAGSITPAQTYTTGSAGVVHLAYNVARTRLFGAGYGSQKIDIWDTTAADGSLAFLQAIPTNNASSHPHQTVVSPAGNIAVVNDLGLDTLHVLAVADDAAIAIATSVPVPAGCGPRHGAFYAAPGAPAPQRYLVACETAHTLLVYNLTATGEFAAAPPQQPLQAPLQTAVGASGANLTAAELLLHVNADASADVYVSNRLTGGATDSIAHFRLPAPASAERGSQPGDLVALTEADVVSSGGVGPRGMSLSADGAWLFVGNQQAGPAGLAVLARDGTTGALGASPVATVEYDVFAGGQGELFGPQFVVEWTGLGGAEGIMRGGKAVARRW